GHRPRARAAPRERGPVPRGGGRACASGRRGPLVGAGQGAAAPRLLRDKRIATRGGGTMTTQTSTMTYTVSASTRAGGTASVHARTSEIAFDGSAQSGEALPGPADLLCAALSACILKNVERFSHMLPFRYESASLEVTAEREEPPPRIVRMH